MQYQVPQFIETEQKIIGGTLTLKQFIILAGGGAASIMLFFVFQFFIWIIFTVFIGVFVLIFFIKINGQPMTSLIGSAFLYYWNPTLYLWRGESAKLPELPLTHTTLRSNSKPTAPIPQNRGVERVYQAPDLPKAEDKLPKWAETTPSPAPVAKKTAPAPPAASATDIRRQIASGGSVQNLWEKITTSKLAVPKREKPMSPFRLFQKAERYEVLRKATGEKELARRIDYK